MEEERRHASPEGLRNEKDAASTVKHDGNEKSTTTTMNKLREINYLYFRCSFSLCFTIEQHLFHSLAPLARYASVPPPWFLLPSSSSMVPSLWFLLHVPPSPLRLRHGTRRGSETNPIFWFFRRLEHEMKTNDKMTSKVKQNGLQKMWNLR